jgi:type IV pilus assembly protein PilM
MTRRTVAVDIGSRWVKVVVLAREGDQVRVARSAAQEIEDSSPAAKAQALARAMRAAGIRARKVVCAVGRTEAVIKRIHLPPADRETVSKLLQFEAQQHLPFPLEEMAWDFEVDEDGSVLLVAARKRAVEAAREVLAQAGLRAAAVSVSSAGAAAAYLHHAAPGTDETAVLIELGAGPVVVNVFRGRQWLLSRPLGIGGDGLTTAFALALGCGIEQARSVRDSQGLAALADGAAQLREWLQTLRAETERSLLAAAGPATAPTVQRIVATGGGWLTPGLADAVSEALGRPLEMLETAGAPGSLFATATGLGLARGINLLSSASAGGRRQTRRWVGSAIAVGALLAALALGTWRYCAVQQQLLARPTVARLEAQMQDLRVRQRVLTARRAEVERRLRPRHQVLSALQELSAAAPPGVWLTSVSFSPRRAIAVQGKAESATTVTSLLDALGRRVTLTYLRQGDGHVEFAITMQGS